jgi:Peroxiredoxin
VAEEVTARPQLHGLVRTTYLIDEDGKVANRWDNVRVDGHAEAVLAAVNDNR